jgi:general L-amino acid transport system permease protein
MRRAVAWQSLAVVLVVLAIGFFVHNTLENLARNAVASGFGFLSQESGFPIGESVIDSSATDSYGRALLIGLLNTLKVSAIGLVLATLLGALAGIALLSSNWLLSRLVRLYVESVRNVPLLLQLFLWYGLLTQALPVPRQAWQPLPGWFLSNRGLKLPAPGADPAWLHAGLALLAGLVLGVAVRRIARRRRAQGQSFPAAPLAAAAIIGLPLLALLADGGGAVEWPHLQGFNFAGGWSLSPELLALLTGLVLYTASYIADIVRSGILAVPRGQTDAGLALGLSRARVLRLVVLPQALRVIVPPLTSQYLNLVKNSSLAVAIGFPDLVGVASTAINQTGQAIEGIAIIMAAYLSISLSLSALMNWYNARIALRGGGR